MQAPVVLVHSSSWQPLWEQSMLTQVGPAIQAALQHGELSVERILGVIGDKSPVQPGVLLHYSDPFLLQARPLRGLRQWQGPRLFACGDLHHGTGPIETLAAYLEAEPHDAVLLTFNPALVADVRQRLRVPVRSLPPSFFRYPAAVPVAQPRRELLHVGSLGPHHPRRRELVNALQARGRVPLRHATTSSAEEAAALYAQHALVLNVPLNHDLNHRFFEVMAAGVPQVVFGDSGLVGEHRHLAERPDVFWASNLEQLEELVLQLLAEPERLRAIPVAPPPYWEMKDLLKAALAP
jgi:hypothetical protein